MNADDLTPGLRVRVITARVVAGRSWQGMSGKVWGEFGDDTIRDWCLVQIDYDGTVIIGFAPDELDADS